MSFELGSQRHLSYSFDRNLNQQNSFLPTMSLHSITEYLDDIKMSRRRGKDYENVDYIKLASSDNGFVDAQFTHPPPKVPWKAVTLATLLFIAGSSLLIIGSLIVSGKIDSKYADRAYHVRIAYYAFRQVPGYSFDDIPEFD
ncbi:hypothetical protein FQR65_LT09013 [Abscondita terminalis]|nr:hypothetical protein FQR65_LT09013 [Abscondita terminalis]